MVEGTAEELDLGPLPEAVARYASPEEVAVVARAIRFSREMHAGQKRASGEPYCMHPYEVAQILAGLEADGCTVAAGLLHDVLEDTPITAEQLKGHFGGEVARLVEGVTKLGKLSFSSKEERQAENFRRMFLAMAQDVRVILVKLADRLHNMRTLKHLSEQKQRDIATETLEIFAPLAHRLGMGRIKWELEDMCLRYLHPDEYQRVRQLVAERRDEREAYIAEIIGKIKEELADAEITGEVQGRAKHFYSIWNKMQEQQKDFSDLYDVTAVRVLVDSIKECYEVLGIVHSVWRPIPGRFKDYIAMPKPNLYQSLHTSVIGPGGKPVEVQIRTFEMHRVAEYGIAAHWRYKEGQDGGNALNAADEKLTFLRQLLDWQNDTQDAREYLTTVKEDLFADEVFCFTPRGDVYDLARGSTPIDFAYRIHTDVGHRCIGAKVNSRIVPLDHQLKNGDIVEILTSKNGKPSLDWLNFVATNATKNKIRSWFKKQLREENVTRGRESLERELGREGLEQILKGDAFLKIAIKLNYPTGEDLLAAIGYGERTSGQVASLVRTALTPEPEVTAESLNAASAPPARKMAPAGTGILVNGDGNMLVNLSKCCSPLPGEPIVGVVTRGRGISIHGAECPNARIEPERRIDVDWAGAAQATYPVEIEVEVIDRVGILKDITIKIADIKTNIRTVKVRTTRDKIVLITMIIDVVDLNHLQKVLSTLNRIGDVIRANRVVRTRRNNPHPARRPTRA